MIAICEKMMQKKPDERPQSAAEVATALRNWLRDNPAPLDVSQAAIASISMKAANGNSTAEPPANPNAASAILSALPHHASPVDHQAAIVVAAAADLRVPSFTANDGPVPTSDILVEDSSPSLLKSRQQRQRRSQKAPWWFWAMLGLLTLTAIVLAIWVALQ